MVEFHVPVQGDIDATKMMKCWCLPVPLLLLVIATVIAEREMSLKAYLEVQERKVLLVEDKIRQRNDGTLETKPEQHQLRKESSEKTRQVKQEANGNDAPLTATTRPATKPWMVRVTTLTIQSLAQLTLPSFVYREPSQIMQTAYPHPDRPRTETNFQTLAVLASDCLQTRSSLPR